jgi:nucleoside permease NupC
MRRLMTRMVTGVVMAMLLLPAASHAQQQRTRTLGSEFGMSVASGVASIVYFPIKLVVGTVGAVVGGFGGMVTGGNERVAKGIWRPMVGGSYFVTPETLEGQRQFLPFNGGPYLPSSSRPIASGSTHP